MGKNYKLLLTLVFISTIPLIIYLFQSIHLMNYPLESEGVLFVHAYAVYVKDGVEFLDPMMQQAIDHVARKHHRYSSIILLGGWHTKELGEFRLLGDVMYSNLVAAGVPKEKMRTLHDFKFQFNYMPPRSTEEEIILARSILDIESHRYITACLINHFSSKAIWFYQRLGVQLNGLDLVTVDLPPSKTLDVVKSILSKLEDLKLDPALKSPSIVAHLAGRTMGEGYLRPDPSIYFDVAIGAKFDKSF